MSPRRSVQTGRRNAYADSPSIQRSLANGGFLQEDVAKPSIQRPSGLGRVATDTSPDSSPESRRWRFASRKLPLADESCRPTPALRSFAGWTTRFGVELLFVTARRRKELRPKRINAPT